MSNTLANICKRKLRVKPGMYVSAVYIMGRVLSRVLMQNNNPDFHLWVHSVWGVFLLKKTYWMWILWVLRLQCLRSETCKYKVNWYSDRKNEKLLLNLRIVAWNLCNRARRWSIVSGFHIRFRDINVAANGSLHGCKTVDFSVLTTNVRYVVVHIHVTPRSE